MKTMIGKNNCFIQLGQTKVPSQSKMPMVLFKNFYLFSQIDFFDWQAHSNQNVKWEHKLMSRSNPRIHTLQALGLNLVSNHPFTHYDVFRAAYHT
jgi:hypothetical protein